MNFMPRQPDDTPRPEPTAEKKGEKPAAERPETPEKVQSFEEVAGQVMQETGAAVAGIQETSAEIKAQAAAKGAEMTPGEKGRDQQIVAESEAVRAAEMTEAEAVAEAARMSELVGPRGTKEDYGVAEALVEEDAKVLDNLTEAEIDQALEPLKEMPAEPRKVEELPESEAMQALRMQVAELNAKIETTDKTESMNFRGGEAAKKMELESLNKKLEQLQDKVVDQVDKEAGVEKLGAVEAAAADVLKKEGFVDVAPAEILKTLDTKDVAQIHELLNKGDADGLKALLEKQMDKVAEGSGAKERMAEVKGETVASMQEVLKRTMDEQVSAKVFSMMSFKEKASVFAGPILKKVGLNIGLGVAAGFGAAALIGTGGAAALVAGGAMAGWRFVENSAWGKKMLSKIGMGGPNTKRLDDLRQKAQEMIIKDVLTPEKISAMASSVIRRESSKKLVADIKEFGEEGKKLDAGEEKDLEKFDKALGQVSPEFFRSALAKIKAERPELSAEQAKEAAMLIAVTTGRFERGQAMEDQLRNNLKKDKPGFFAVMDKFAAIRAGTAGDSSKDKLFFGAMTVALGATTASVARQSRWGRAVTTGIAGGLLGFALGKRAEAKAEARVVEESEKMVDEAEKSLSDIDFPSEKLDTFRQDAAQVAARLQSGMFDRFPALKERAENFVFQVDKLEMKNRQNMDHLLETMTKTNDQVATNREADLAKLDKIYKSGQRRKVLYTLGGMAMGAVAGYYAQDAVDAMKKQLGWAQTQEAAPVKHGEQRPSDPLEPQRGEAGHSDAPPPPQEIKLTPEQVEAQELMALGTIRKGEGITHVLTRQLEFKAQHNPELASQLGFKGDVNNAAAVHRWAVLESRRLAIENHYINPNGTEVRVRFNAKEPAQYLLEEKGGKFGVTEQHTAGREYMWRPKPPAVEVQPEPEPTAELPKTKLPEQMTPDQALERLRNTGPDPVLDERLRLNMARGEQTPQDVAWLKSELGKRFETITGEIKAKTAELEALRALEGKTTDAELLQRLKLQEASLEGRIRSLNQTGEAYHRSFLAPREEPAVDLSTGRKPVGLPTSETMVAGSPEAIQVARQFNLDTEAQTAMTGAHLSPERVATVISEAKKAGLTANQAVIGESWLRRAGTDMASQDALKKSLLQLAERGAVSGQRGRIDLGGGKSIEYMAGYDAKRAAQFVLEHRLGVKMVSGPVGAAEHLEPSVAVGNQAEVTPVSRRVDLPAQQNVGGTVVERPVGSNVVEQQGAGVTNVASKVEVKTLTSGIGGSVEQISSGHGRADFVYDTFGRIKGLQRPLEMKLGVADDAQMRALLRPDFRTLLRGQNPSLAVTQAENSARAIYAHEQMASELAKAGKVKEAAYLMQIADDMRVRASSRIGDVFVPPAKK